MPSDIDYERACPIICGDPHRMKDLALDDHYGVRPSIQYRGLSMRRPFLVLQLINHDRAL